MLQNEPKLLATEALLGLCEKARIAYCAYGDMGEARLGDTEEARKAMRQMLATVNDVGWGWFEIEQALRELQTLRELLRRALVYMDHDVLQTNLRDEIARVLAEPKEQPATKEEG